MDLSASMAAALTALLSSWERSICSSGLRARLSRSTSITLMAITFNSGDSSPIRIFFNTGNDRGSSRRASRTRALYRPSCVQWIFMIAWWVTSLVFSSSDVRNVSRVLRARESFISPRERMRRNWSRLFFSSFTRLSRLLENHVWRSSRSTTGSKAALPALSSVSMALCLTS